jgi:predicted ester cyclase
MANDGPMSIEATRDVMQRYLAGDHGDLSMLSPDVVFRVMATGEEHRGPDGVQAMLDFFYHRAFDATANTRHFVVGEGVAVLEADFVGRHIGEFAGVAPTDKTVTVPLAVVYDVADDVIVEGRIYFEVPAFLAQISGA